MLFLFLDHYKCRLDLGGGLCLISIDPHATLGLGRLFCFPSKGGEPEADIKFSGRFAKDITHRNYEIYPDSSLITE